MSRPASQLPPAFDRVGAFVRGHVPFLDGVRGLAIVLLLMHQFILEIPPGAGAAQPARWLERVLQPGWVGVQLFFVLSGFLITGVLVDSKGERGYFRSFYGRRALRIFPLYYLLLVSLVFVAPRLWTVPEVLRADPGASAPYWFYLSNWSEHGVQALGHCWSLAVEEQFYVLWPLVVVALGGRRLIRLCIGLAVLSLAFRMGVRALGLDPEIAYENTFARMDALALGAVGAVSLRDPAAVAWLRPRLPGALVGATILLSLSATQGFGRTATLTQTLGYSALAIWFALVVVTGVIQQADGAGRLASMASVPPLRILGKYSYGIYIVQLPLHILVSRVLLAEPLAFREEAHYVVVQIAYSLGMLGLVFVLALLSYHLVEKRFLALKGLFRTTPVNLVQG